MLSYTIELIVFFLHISFSYHFQVLLMSNSQATFYPTPPATQFYSPNQPNYPSIPPPQAYPVMIQAPAQPSKAAPSSSCCSCACILWTICCLFFAIIVIIIIVAVIFGDEVRAAQAQLRQSNVRRYQFS